MRLMRLRKDNSSTVEMVEIFWLAELEVYDHTSISRSSRSDRE